MNSSRTRTTDIDILDSDYNAYGYDPLGLIAHACHHFFGPEWQPETQYHLEGLCITGQPRYGQPTTSQADKLPRSFTPRPPPFYFGTPSPPYITGPPVFDPKLLSGAISCLARRKNTNTSKALCYKRIHGTEVMDGVYRLDIKIIANDCEDGYLSILSNTTWALFYLQVQDRFGMKDLQLFYKARDTSYVSEPEFKQLEGEKDWAEVMAIVKQAFQSYRDVELEVLHKDVDVDNRSFNENQDEDVLLDLETFYFKYPSLRNLVDHMNEAFSEEHGALEDHEYKSLLSSGIEYLDDFTLMSTAKLHTWTCIPMEKLRRLYGCAEAMIREFHAGKEKEIKEIWEFRAAGCGDQCD